MDVNLILLKDNGLRKHIPLPKNVAIIGRASNCDLRIPIMSVSKKHCRLKQSNGVLKIRDLSSRNGTYINGKRIDEAVIQAGDSIRIGPLAFVLQLGGQPETVGKPPPEKRNLRQQVNPTENKSFDDSPEINDLDSLLDDFYSTIGNDG